MNARLDVRALAAAISYQDLRDYLLARRWTSVPSRRAEVAIFRSPGAGDVEIQLPLDTSLADYADAITLAARRLAEHDRRDVEAVLHDLAEPRRDVIRYALSGDATARGTIDLLAGSALISGAVKSLLASACSVQRPRRVHPRMTLADAEAFVRECRLGQTELGSYVLTIDAPLDVRDDVAQGEIPFGRRTTSYLIEATGYLASTIRSGEPSRVLEDDPEAPLVSANLCEALVEMMPADESADLRLATTWSPLIPAPARARSEVRLERAMFESIERIAQQLRPAQGRVAAHFVGTVVELSGSPSPSGQLEGDVVLQVQVDDQLLKVRVNLDADDYRRAVEAHLHQRFVSVRGVLHRGRRAHHLAEARDFAVLPE